MKVLYISIGHAADGVRKKLEDKVSAIRREGIDCDLWHVVPQTSNATGNAKVIAVDYGLARKIARWPVLWRLSVYFEQHITYKVLAHHLKKTPADLIILRYPVADVFLWRLMRSFPGKIVFEHNTLEREELALRAQGSFWYRYFSKGEQRYGKKVRALAAGLVGVTPEITARQVRTAGATIPHTTISNGINVERVAQRNGVSFNGDELNLLLLAGAAAPWHGTDILFNSLRAYDGPCNIHCYIAGSIPPDMQTKVHDSPRITLLPNQSGEALDELVNKCHLGVGTLGLSESFLRQACTLKVREYWSRGLPFIMGYDDVDLMENDAMQSFFLKVHVDMGRRYFNLEEAVAFAGKVYRMDDFSGKMRTLAQQHIDYQVKGKAYADFLRKLQG